MQWQHKCPWNSVVDMNGAIVSRPQSQNSLISYHFNSRLQSGKKIHNFVVDLPCFLLLEQASRKVAAELEILHCPHTVSCPGNFVIKRWRIARIHPLQNKRCPLFPSDFIHWKTITGCSSLLDLWPNFSEWYEIMFNELQMTWFTPRTAVQHCIGSIWEGRRLDQKPSATLHYCVGSSNYNSD